MKTNRRKKKKQSKIAPLRREEIIEAAIAVITEQGLQNLSLSEIEKRADMSRGQLTYYFPTKEDILLAVFDRLVFLVHQGIGAPAGKSCAEVSAWDWVKHLFEKLLTEPPVAPEFGCLQYTFLSQIGHREDFRRKLAELYEQWRSGMALGFASDVAQGRTARSMPPRAMATLVQAILHGLAMQKAADPNAYDEREVLKLCLDVLSTYLWNKPSANGKNRSTAPTNSAPVLPARARRLAGRRATKGVNGERVHG
ncbi:MAG: TetR/AcrR family transcriptional regulator [Planctomycetota bacterium]|nr:MAG: TetR/AcrR family transcriptional regulator [Planctomycetota bacterium]